MDFESFTQLVPVDKHKIEEHGMHFHSSDEKKVSFVGWFYDNTFIVKYYYCLKYQNLVEELADYLELHMGYVEIHTTEPAFVELLQRYGFRKCGKLMCFDTSVEYIRIYHPGYRPDFSTMALWVKHVRPLFSNLPERYIIEKSMETYRGEYVVVVGLVMGYVKHALIFKLKDKTYSLVAARGERNEALENTISQFKSFEYGTMGDDIKFLNF